MNIPPAWPGTINATSMTPIAARPSAFRTGKPSAQGLCRVVMLSGLDIALPEGGNPYR